MMNEIQIAKIGRSVGLRGDLKIHHLGDFPEQFKKGASFNTHKFGELKVCFYNHERLLIRFEGYEDQQLAKKLTNTILLTSEEKTRQNCNLKDDEFFWFDIIYCKIFENDELLGTVSEIQRIVNQDYLHIKTHKTYVQKGYAKSFLLPFISKYIIKTNIQQKSIHVNDGLVMLENS